MPIRLLPYYKSTVYLEDEDGISKPVTVHVARLDPAASAEFRAGMKRMNEPPSNRLLGGRRPDGPEQERDDTNAFVIGDAEILQRRIAELDGDAKAAYEQADEDDETWARRFVQASIEQFVSVPTGEITNAEGEAVTTGSELVRFFASNADVLRQLVFAVQHENTLSPHQKKALKSLSASRHGLLERQCPVVGEKPEPTVLAASPLDSAVTAAATASTEDLSGSAVEMAASR